ncbi:MAG TPA: ATP-binding protein [Allocoleopsis sp.]
MLDLGKFFQATNPAKTLAVENEEDQKYYIDFSSVRGQDIFELRDNISELSDGQPTCGLFTGHIGSGKSTELLRLKKELQQQGFHVVYFESDQDLEMGDIDVSDILLTIANRVSLSLEESGIQLQSKSLLNELQEFLQSMQMSGIKFVPLGIAEIAAEIKASPNLRNRLRGY